MTVMVSLNVLTVATEAMEAGQGASLNVRGWVQSCDVQAPCRLIVVIRISTGMHLSFFFLS